MPANKYYCSEQIERLECLPYWNALGDIGKGELVEALYKSCRHDQDAEAAITGILLDTARASSAELNRVPSPGEIVAWVHARIEAERSEWKPPPPPAHCFPCSGTGRVGLPGWKPDWSMTTAEIDAACEAAKVPCPDCQDAIEWEPKPEPEPMPVQRECCTGGIAVIAGRADYCGCALGLALRNKNRVMA